MESGGDSSIQTLAGYADSISVMLLTQPQADSILERGSSFPSCIVRAKEQPEGPSPRPC
jgi:hypothetical protein